MSSIQCHKCKKNCVFKPRPKDDEMFGAPCDFCKYNFCKDCSALTTTEAHAVALAQRKLIYLCQECKRLTKNLPEIKKIIEQLDRVKKECRKKDITIENLDLTHNQQVEELESRIHSLAKETAEKDVHIERLRRKTQDFEESVFSTEQEYIENINQQKEQISLLEKQITVLKEKNKSLSSSVKELENKTTGLEGELSKLKSAKLSADNKFEKAAKEHEGELKLLEKRLQEEKQTNEDQHKDIMEKNSVRITNLEKDLQEVKRKLHNESVRHIVIEGELKESILEIKAKVGRINITNDSIRKTLQGLEKQKIEDIPTLTNKGGAKKKNSTIDTQKTVKNNAARSKTNQHHSASSHQAPLNYPPKANDGHVTTICVDTANLALTGEAACATGDKADENFVSNFETGNSDNTSSSKTPTTNVSPVVSKIPTSEIKSVQITKNNKDKTLDNIAPSQVNVVQNKTADKITLSQVNRAIESVIVKKNGTRTSSNTPYGVVNVGKSPTDEAGKNLSDEMQWCEVKSRRRKPDKSRPAPTRGTNEEENALIVAKNLSWIFVSGLDTSTTPNQVLKFLEGHSLTDRSSVCEKMKTKSRKCNSFKLGVSSHMKSQVMLPDLWPKGTIINHFLNLQRLNQVP